MKTDDIGSNSDYAEEAFTFEQTGEVRKFISNM